MKKSVVTITKKAEKDLRKIPRYILVQFDEWVETIETDGHKGMQHIKGYKDHALKGDRKRQRSSYLSRSYRVIYELDEKKELTIVNVQEVNKHDY